MKKMQVLGYTPRVVLPTYIYKGIAPEMLFPAYLETFHFVKTQLQFLTVNF
jgi:hypothetical protein